MLKNGFLVKEYDVIKSKNSIPYKFYFTLFALFKKNFPEKLNDTRLSESQIKILFILKSITNSLLVIFYKNIK